MARWARRLWLCSLSRLYGYDAGMGFTGVLMDVLSARVWGMYLYPFDTCLVVNISKFPVGKDTWTTH